MKKTRKVSDDDVIVRIGYDGLSIKKVCYMYKMSERKVRKILRMRLLELEGELDDTECEIQGIKNALQKHSKQKYNK